MTESRNDGMTDRLKTVYPPKTSFCGGYNKGIYKGKTAPSRRHNFFFSQKWVGEILGSKVPSRYIQHRVNSRRGIAGLSCTPIFTFLLQSS